MFEGAMLAEEFGLEDEEGAWETRGSLEAVV